MKHQIGIMYSVATGIVSRVINPDHDFPEHLDNVVVPEGMALLRIDKDAIGATEESCPNLDFLIPYCKKNHDKDLKFGERHIIVDEDNNVIDEMLCCPVLYQQKLDKDAEEYNTKLKHPNSPVKRAHKCIKHDHAEVGDTFDLVKQELKIHAKNKRKDLEVDDK